MEHGLQCSPQLIQVKIRPKWDWNMSMRMKGNTTLIVKIRPKWDWNERRMESRGWANKLKSDQNGIEIQWILWRNWLIYKVKIRPKWDWNDFIRDGIHDVIAALKSDQNGIEIHRVGEYEASGWIVKIRPKWDWNDGTVTSHSHSYAG